MRCDTCLWWMRLRGAASCAVIALLLLAAGCGESEPAEQSEQSEQTTTTEATEPDPEVVQQKLRRFEGQFAEIFEGDGDEEALLADMEAFVSAYPEVYEGRRMYAQTLQMVGQAEAAFEQFEKAVTLRPEDAELRLLVGDLAMQLGRYDRAQRHYSRARGMQPRSPRFRVRLGMALVEQRRYDEARLELLEAIQLDSSYASAYVALADLYARQNRIDEALTQIDRALERVDAGDDDRRVKYVQRQASLLRRDNRPAEALAVLRDLPAERQLDVNVAQDMARCWMMLGQPERAAEHFDLILRRDATDDIAAAQAASWHLKAGQLDEARERVSQLRRINPNSPAIPTLERSLDNGDATDQ